MLHQGVLTQNASALDATSEPMPHLNRSNSLRLSNLLLHYFADLHHAGRARVVSLVGDELVSRRRESAYHLFHGAKKKVADSMVGRRRTRWQTSNAAIDLRPHQAPRRE